MGVDRTERVSYGYIHLIEFYLYLLLLLCCMTSIILIESRSHR